MCLSYSLRNKQNFKLSRNLVLCVAGGWVPGSVTMGAHHTRAAPSHDIDEEGKIKFFEI